MNTLVYTNRDLFIGQKSNLYIFLHELKAIAK